MIAPNITLDGQTILVTGAAGFIGANLAEGLLASENGITVIGFDNVNDYYDVRLKEARLEKIEETAKKRPDNRWVNPFFDEIAAITVGSLVVRKLRVRVEPSAEPNATLPRVEAAQPLKCSDVSGLDTVGAEASATGR